MDTPTVYSHPHVHIHPGHVPHQSTRVKCEGQIQGKTLQRTMIKSLSQRQCVKTGSYEIIDGELY